jgi:hypothetical protein
VDVTPCFPEHIVNWRVQKIVSGGQTGVDRAALDFAVEQGVDYGGFVPRGRRDEAGLIPTQYSGLIEAPCEESAVRTTLNVCQSDGTVIFSHGPLTGGTALTADLANAIRRPLLLIDLSRVTVTEAAFALAEWIRQNSISVLNIAGPRRSEDATAYDGALAILRLTLPGGQVILSDDEFRK